MRVLLLNLSAGSLDASQRALAGQGYEIIAESGSTVEQILTLSPEILVTEAMPSDLSCGRLIAQIRTHSHAGPSVKVEVIVHGGAFERARALDLGADDVLSFPFDEVEFAARIRAQFRERQPQEELMAMLKYANQSEHYADIALESLSGGTVSRRRFWLISALLGLTATAVLVLVISSRSNRRATLQLRADIARFSNGLQPQADLRRTAGTLSGIDPNSHSPSATRDSLKAQSEDLRRRTASADGANTDSLKKQLLDTQNRLAHLEKEEKIAETIVHKYGPSVCLLHVVMEFVDKQSGRPIQVALDANGKPQIDEKGMAQLDVGGGRGPRLQVDVFGTGFLADANGSVLTNHHVAEPWWHDDELKRLLDQGVDPYVRSYEVYFPGNAAAIGAKLDRISLEADLATLQLETPAPPQSKPLEIDGGTEATVAGEPVVLMGYPTGLEGILARTNSDVLSNIAGEAQDVSQIMSRIAAQRLIRPITTQGHIGDVLQDKIVYDAATTSGGSGGPLFNKDGRVIGINFALLRGFGGSNLAVPARYATELLK